MMSKAIKCDRKDCGVVEMLDPDGYSEVFDNGAAKGWIRVFINRPRIWSFDQQARSDHEGWYDCCSISCANEVLRSARPE
jgi:hypothetical protein